MFVLEPYQENIVLSVAQLLASGKNRVLAQLATGGGKTVVFCEITRRYLVKSKKAVLILVHRTELLAQTCRTLKNGFGINAQQIKAGARWIPPSDVYVAMVETVNKRMSQIENIGLVIIDECHLANFNKMFKHFPDQHIIGFSATPKAASKKHPLKNYYQEIVCGVNIPELISMNKRNPERGLVQNITRVPQITVSRADLAQHMDMNGDFSVDMMAQQFSKPQNIQNTVDAYRRFADKTKAIVFNVNIEHSLKTMQAFRDAGYDCKHVDGEMDPGTRERVLKWFKETPGAILCNVAVLTTGYDEPTIETVIVNRSTTSLPLWLQMCGRGARPLPWKMHFTIIDMGDNARSLEDWNFAHDWYQIFWTPEQETKPGTAPVKDCPQCAALVPAQTRICPYCGHTWPAKPAAPEIQIDDFIVITKDIDVAGLIEASRTKKQYYPFFQIGDDIARNAYATITEMSDTVAEFTLNEYFKKATEWAIRENKRWDEWHQSRARNHLFTKLRGLYPNWTPNVN